MSEYYGYNCYIIDKTGKILVELDNVSYPSLDSDFRQGLAPVGNDDGWGYINKKGTFVIPANFKSAGPFMGDYAAASIKVRGQQFGEKFGYIDKRGEFVIEPKFDSVTTHIFCFDDFEKHVTLFYRLETFVVTIPCMEMRRLMIGKVHPDVDSIKETDLWHI